MPARRGVSRGTRRMPVVRRKWIWARRVINAAPVGATSSVFSDLLTDIETAIGADLVGVSIMRIRGMVRHNMALGQFAIRTFTSSTFATLTNAQGPSNDPYADWMLYQPLMAEGPVGDNFTNVEIDSKAARRLDEVGQGLLLGVSNLTAQADAVFNADLSIGVKLP